MRHTCYPEKGMIGEEGHRGNYGINGAHMLFGEGDNGGFRQDSYFIQINGVGIGGRKAVGFIFMGCR